MSTLNDLEQAVLDKLLVGDEPGLACLRAQQERMRVAKREYSGVGFFTEFTHPPDAPRLQGARSIRFGDVLADISGLDHGAGFLLFIDGGLITMLEGYTNSNEPWPASVEAFELRYWEPRRDLSAFREA